MTLRELIVSDLKRLEDNINISWKSFLRHYLFPRGEVFRYTVWLRIFQYAKGKRRQN